MFLSILLLGAPAFPENVYMAATMGNRKQDVDLTMNVSAQANGMVAVLQMIVAPSITSQEVLIFHVNRGQILSFPLTEDEFTIFGAYCSCNGHDPERPERLERAGVS